MLTIEHAAGGFSVHQIFSTGIFSHPEEELVCGSKAGFFIDQPCDTYFPEQPRLCNDFAQFVQSMPGPDMLFYNIFEVSGTITPPPL